MNMSIAISLPTVASRRHARTGGQRRMSGKLYGYTPCVGASGANNPSTEYRVPAVAMERQFRFVVNTRDNGFEPPPRARLGMQRGCVPH